MGRSISAIRGGVELGGLWVKLLYQNEGGVPI